MDVAYINKFIILITSLVAACDHSTRNKAKFVTRLTHKSMQSQYMYSSWMNYDYMPNVMDHLKRS